MELMSDRPRYETIELSLPPRSQTILGSSRMCFH